MAVKKFDTLESIFSIMVPAGLSGNNTLQLRTSRSTENAAFKKLDEILESSARGVKSVAALKQEFENLVKLSSDEAGKDQLNKHFDFYSTQGSFSFSSNGSKLYVSAVGPKQVGGFSQIIGTNVRLKDSSILVSRSPFFHPCRRNVEKSQIFLNSMPSIVVSSLTPYLDVEFQIRKDQSNQIQSPSTLKFLLGAADKTGLRGANKALAEGSSIVGADKIEYDYAGIELFTTPQLSVNPQPNFNIGASGDRSVAIIDPFRPLASLEQVSITLTPSVGMFSYKKAKMSLIVHDRSRLSELSDLIRPRSYDNVTIWLTYGWRAPTRSGGNENPYFEYVNNHMLAREAYTIINSSFSFDDVGQVKIDIELSTKGAIPAQIGKLSAAKDDMETLTNEIKQLSSEIYELRRKLKLDPPEGVNKEIRVFQILDSASSGAWPDYKPNEVADIINTLKSGKKGTKDSLAIETLISKLKTLYKPGPGNTFDFKGRLESTATATVKKRFDNVMMGPDVFLPGSDKISAKGSVADSLVTEIENYNKAPQSKVTNFKPKVVSFGKVFSTFALGILDSQNLVDEVQLYFYSLNDRCGPVSGHSIAEFPIDMSVFLDQYRDHVLKRGGENVTLDEFLRLLIYAQVLDDRAIGYGLRAYYEPYDPNNKDPQVIGGKQKEFESATAEQSKKHGSFVRPVIEMYVETVHEMAGVGEYDLLKAAAYSAAGISQSQIDSQTQKRLKQIMRIHVYDKTVNPYNEAAQLLRANNGKGSDVFIQEKSNNSFVNDLSNLKDRNAVANAVNGQISRDPTTAALRVGKFTDQNQVKDLIAMSVPTIIYGANGSTVTRASLSSKADPLLSTVNMLRANSMKNAASPNGSGEFGLPLRVIPAQLTMTSLGCPLAQMAQLFLIDFNTGTTLDNLYLVTGLTHTLSPGKFETAWSFGYADAYGVFEGAPDIVEQIVSSKGTSG